MLANRIVDSCDARALLVNHNVKLYAVTQPALFVPGKR